VGYFFGLLNGEIRNDNMRADELIREIEPILADDPKFSDVRVQRWDGGMVMFTGRVASTADFERLRRVLIMVIGKKHADLALQPVNVGK